MQESNRGSGYSSGYVMEDAIELREYVFIIVRHLKLIVGCAVVAVIAAAVISFATPPTYEAASMVLITESRYQMRFEPRLETVDQQRTAYGAVQALATTDAVLQAVVGAYQPSPAAEIEDWRLRGVKRMVSANAGADASLVELKVSSRSPEDAAQIANVWAGELVAWVNEIYTAGEDDAVFFENQVAQARRALDDAEQELISFQARDRSRIVSTQLDSYEAIRSEYLADQRRILHLIQDIEGLRGQLIRQSGVSPSLADDLTALFLQLRAFNVESPSAIELQISSAESISQKSRDEQRAFLQELVGTLEARESAIDERLTALEPMILESQEDLQQIQTEGRRLDRAQTVAEETYLTLSRKLEEARISAQEAEGILQVGSLAAVPESPTGPRRMMNMALAGVVGGMVGLGAAFAWEWWEGGRADAERASRGAAGRRS